MSAVHGDPFDHRKRWRVDSLKLGTQLLDGAVTDLLPNHNIVLNEAGATCTDTIHRLNCNGDPTLLITNTYTYLTGACAEIEGRSYGGGMLALEPTEAERLLVPTQLVQAMTIKDCNERVRSGQLENLLQENSERILIVGIG